MKPTHILALAAMLTAAPFLPAQNPPAAAAVPHPIPSIQDTETPTQKDARMEWWRQARFGMFIHWGLYSVPGGHLGRQADSLAGRVDHEQRVHPRRRIQGAGQAVQSHRLLRARHCGAGKIRRHEVHRHHLQAPRRLRHVRLEGRPVQHRRRHAVPPRPAARTRRRSAQAGHQARLLLLAGPGLDCARRRGHQARRPPAAQLPLGQGPGRRLRHLPAHQGNPADQGTALELWRLPRRALVRHANQGHDAGAGERDRRRC